MWWKKIDNVNQQKHVEFYGRLTSDGNVARLYPHLEINTEQSQTQDRGGRLDLLKTLLSSIEIRKNLNNLGIVYRAVVLNLFSYRHPLEYENKFLHPLEK